MNFLRKAVSLFSSTHSESDSYSPSPRSIYGVSKGKYLGEFLVYIKSESDNMHFLSLPKMTQSIIPVEKFKTGIDTGVLEFQEILPKKIYDTCAKQYEQSKKSNS